MIGEGFPEGFPTAPEPAVALAAALPDLLDTVHLAQAARLVAHSLLSQLGSMCAEHTRKATILQGLLLATRWASG